VAASDLIQCTAHLRHMREKVECFKIVMVSHNLRDGPDERMYIHICLYVTGNTKRWRDSELTKAKCPRTQLRPIVDKRFVVS
jgi:hypothetical protein